MADNIIKVIVSVNCPHCKGEVFVESLVTPSVIGSVFSREELLAAKKDLCLRIEALSIPEEKKGEVLRWVNKPDTIFAPGEVDAIIDSLLKPEE